MEALYQLDAGLPNSICLTRIWDSIAPESTLRRMIVDKAVVYIERSYLIDNMDDNPTGFVQDLAVSLLRQIPLKGLLSKHRRVEQYLEVQKETAWASRRWRKI